MMAWSRDECGQFAEKVDGRKHDVGGAVAKGAFKLVLHLPVFSEAQTDKTDGGRARDIPA